MNQKNETIIPQILQKYEKELLSDWIKEQLSAATFKTDLISEQELRGQSAEFLNLLGKGTRKGNMTDIMAPEWQELRDVLTRISRDRAERGFSSSQVAVFIFSFKQPLFSYLARELSHNLEALKTEMWSGTVFLDNLGLYITAVYQKSREDIIARQQRELLELSTPVVKLWPGILALPLIGTLDSERTQIVMESLLHMIAETSSTIAIIDITGVPTVDTLVAQHLIKTVAAARLMGSECFISGIRPEIAQTIVHLGVSLPNVITKATLADAFAIALRQIGFEVVKPHEKG